MWIAVVASLLVSLLACALAWRASRPRPVAEGELADADVRALRAEVAALKQEVGGALRHLAVVRYDAFGDMGGHLSWSVAMLDDAGDGVLFTSIHGRSEARTYARTVTAWTCEQPLSDEESQALRLARKS